MGARDIHIPLLPRFHGSLRSSCWNHECSSVIAPSGFGRIFLLVDSLPYCI